MRAAARRREAGVLCAVTVACAAWVSHEARAERAIDAALLTMPVDGYGLTLVDRAQTPQRFEFGMRAQIGWSSAPLRVVLNDPSMGLTEQRFRLIDQQWTVDAGFSFGLFDFLALSAAVPIAAGSYDDAIVGDPVVPGPAMPMNPAGMSPTSGSGLSANQPRQNVGITRAGARDPRLAIKARFYGGRWFEIGTVLEATVPLGDSSSFLGERGATFRPRLVLGALLKRVGIFGSFGGIVRESASFAEPNPQMAPQMTMITSPPIRLAIGHELSWGAALTARLHRTFGLGVEAVGTIPVAGDSTEPTAAAIGALHVLPHEKLRLTLSGGGGLLTSSARNAEGRVLIGLAYSLSPRIGGLL